MWGWSVTKLTGYFNDPLETASSGQAFVLFCCIPLLPVPYKMLKGLVVLFTRWTLLSLALWAYFNVSYILPLIFLSIFFSL